MDKVKKSKCTECGSEDLCFNRCTGGQCKEGGNPVYVNTYTCNVCLKNITLEESEIGLPSPE